MKLCTFEVETPLGVVSRVGVETGAGRVLDANVGFALLLAERDGHPKASELADVLVPADMLRFIQSGQFGMTALQEATDFLGERADVPDAVGPRGQVLSHEPADVRLMAPLSRPNSLRDTISFERHYANVFGEDNIPDVWYETPLYYKGNADSVLGPDAEVEWPSYTEQLDYELEFVAIIGRRGRDIAVEEADDYVFGYTIYNDVSARDIQQREMQGNLGPAKGKDMDGGNVLGPWIVTADVWDPGDDHAMEVRVDGEYRGGGSTNEMHHSIPRIISYISQSETLYPGDIIGSGTVGTGCGLEIGRYPSPGAVIELEIEGIGVLRNRFVRTTTP